MKKLTALSLVFTIAIIFGSCSVLQKNGKTSEKSFKEQSEDIDEYSKDETDDFKNNR